jgi:sulfatase maturation enzyme AslB (radical SAM superfamily)
MTKNVYCTMIHGGLNIDLKSDPEEVQVNQCCQEAKTVKLAPTETLWNNKKLIELRKLNNQNKWSPTCWSCEGNELSNLNSFRLSMIDKFGERKNLSGPLRIDLLFDTSCNLACRICGPDSSTLWQKHLKENNISFPEEYNAKSRMEDAIRLLKTLDLSNLEILQFCGGETLLGNNYWNVARELVELIPQAKEKLTLGFQTNGTQPIDPKYYELIEKFHLVKILISLDGTKERFDYLRWPADWNQVTDNILQLRENLPNNVMFHFEETFCALNLFYHDEVENWIKQNFSANRLGDDTTHAKHIVEHSILDLSNITQEYRNAIESYDIKNLIPTNWQENPIGINAFIEYIEKFDKIRNQDWTKTFPEVAEFYSRYLR